MATLSPLVPTGMVAAGGWTDEAGGTTNLHLPVDETGAQDGAHIRGLLNDPTTAVKFNFTDTPSNFVAMGVLQVEIRHARGAVEAGDNGGGDDTHSISITITNAAEDTAYVIGELIESGTIGYLSKTEIVSLPLTAAGIAATKSNWDGAVIHLSTGFSQSMGADGDRIWVDFVRLIGTYLANNNLDQVGFRIRNDDGDEDAATWKAAENVDAGVDFDTNFRVRFVVDETAGVAAEDHAFTLWYSKNSAAYVQATTVSTNVRATASSQFADQDATTRQLTSGSGTFATGRMDESGEAGAGAPGSAQLIQFTAGGLTEVEFCMQLRSVDMVASDTIDLRVRRSRPVAKVLEAYTETPRITVIAAAFAQAGFRWRNDDGDEDGATWKGAENVNPSVLLLDQNHRLRFIVDETGGVVAVNDLQLQLQYRKNGASYTNVNSSSTNVRSALSGQFIEEAATTRQLTGGTGTFVAGAMDEAEGLAGEGNQIDLAAGNLTEVEYCFQLRSADLADNDVIDFRLVRAGGILLASYDQTPSFTVQLAGAVDGITLDYDHGPFLAPNGALYAIGMPSPSPNYDKLTVWKSVNEADFTIVGTFDPAGNDGGTAAQFAVAGLMMGDILHVMWSAFNEVSAAEIYYAPFDTFDDSIGSIEVFDTTTNSSGTLLAMHELSNEILVLFRDELNTELLLRHGMAGDWGSEIDYDNDPAFTILHSAAVIIGPTAHLFWYANNVAGGGIYHRVLRADGSLSNVDEVSADVLQGSNNPALPMYFDGKLFLLEENTATLNVWESTGRHEDETWVSTQITTGMDDGIVHLLANLGNAGRRLVVMYVRESDQAICWKEYDPLTNTWGSENVTGDVSWTEGRAGFLKTVEFEGDVYIAGFNRTTDTTPHAGQFHWINIGPAVGVQPPKGGKKEREDKRKRFAFQKKDIARRQRASHIINRPILSPALMFIPGESLLQIINETLEIAAARQNVKGLIRIRDEAVELPETIQRHLGIVRIRNEAVEVAEVVLRILGIIRLRGESVELAEALQKHLGIVKLRNESVEISEAIQHVIGILRQRNESIEISEATLRSLGKTKIVNESVEISEAVQRHLGIVRQRTESVEIAEAVQRHLTILRLHNEAIQLSESIQKHLGIVRNQNESVSVTESIIKVLGLVRQVNEALEIVEATQKVGGKLRQVSEVVELTEADQSIRGIFRQINETVELVEASQLHLGIVRTRNESIELVEQIIRLVAIVRQVNESTEIAEQIIKLLAIVRQQNESVQVTEAILRVLGLVRQHSESVELSETLLSFLGKIRVEGESVNISEATQTILGKIQIHNESVEIVEVIVRPSGIIQVIDESLSSSEATQKHLAILRLINESTDITDQSMRVMALLRLVSEAIQLPEQSITVQTIVRQVSEAVSVVETVQHHLGKAIILNETVNIHETELHFTVFQAFSSTKIKFKAKVNDQKYTQKVGKSFKGKVRE